MQYLHIKWKCCPLVMRECILQYDFHSRLLHAGRNWRPTITCKTLEQMHFILCHYLFLFYSDFLHIMHNRLSDATVSLSCCCFTTSKKANFICKCYHRLHNVLKWLWNPLEKTVPWWIIASRIWQEVETHGVSLLPDAQPFLCVTDMVVMCRE